MYQIKFRKAVIAGIVGTIAMSILVLLAPLMGMSMGAPWEMVAMFLGAPIAVGWLGHFAIGIGFALIYAAFFAPRLRGGPWARGLVYALFPWLLAMILAVPIMVNGPVFAGNFVIAFGSLMGHFVYGAFVGGTYGKAYETATRYAETRRRKGHA